MKLTLSNFHRLKVVHLLRFLPLGTAALLLVLLSGSLIFLYRYFYQTITEVRVVAILRSQVSLTQVNLPLYRQVFTSWESKKKFNPASIENLNDPFKSLPEPTESASAKTIEQANAQPKQ